MPSAMETFRSKLIKTYGEGRVVRHEEIRPYEVVSTGSLTLDYALRTGGWVRGRMHEIVGPPEVGKSTLVINSMAQHQLAYPDLAVAYIDMEQTFDERWALANGLKLGSDKFLHVYPDHSEHVSDLLRQICREAPVSCVVVDSIGGMESKAAFDKDAEDKVMGNNAQIITRMVKHVATLARETMVTCLLVNQYRANVSSPRGGEISAGPRALAYQTTTKVALRRTGEPVRTIKVNGENEEISRQIRAKVERSKVSAKSRVATFWITNQIADGFPEIGIDRADEALSLGTITGVIGQRGGGYYDLPGGEAIRGKDSVAEYLREHPEMVIKIRADALALVAHEVIPETVVTMKEKA
jgi:recombination protein RecA